MLTLTRSRLVLIALTIVGVAVLALWSSRRSADVDPTTAPRSRPAVLDVQLTALDGTRTRVGAYAGGRPLVVNFFASWCGPCVREMPDFETVHLRRRDEVGFLGVNIQDTPEAAAELVQRTGVTYDVARDDRGELLQAVRGVSMPTTAFLDADGNIVAVHNGELTARALEARIDRLFGP